MIAPESRQYALRPGTTLLWGDAPDWSLVAGASVVFAFVLGENDAARGQMLLTSAATARPTLGIFAALVTLDGEALAELLAGDDSASAAQIRAFAQLEPENPLLLPMTAAAGLAVESIRRCPFVGASRAVALTARGNDLLAEFLAALAAFLAPENPRMPPLTRAQTDRIHAVAAQLRRELEHPPALPELARRAGLSETSLKRGFRQIYGATVFGYLRSLRMDRARALLAASETTVLEAAALVGYSNPSNFSAAFRQAFGVNPKEFQLTSRRQ